jgi:two-component system LytT family response regulator
VLVREDGQISSWPVDTIDFVEAKDDYVSIKSGGRRYKKQQTLAELETQLDPTRFARAHRSFLLNIAKIARLDPYAKDSFVAVLHDGSRLPVSRAGRRRLAELLGS